MHTHTLEQISSASTETPALPILNVYDDPRDGVPVLFKNILATLFESLKTLHAKGYEKTHEHEGIQNYINRRFDETFTAYLRSVTAATPKKFWPYTVLMEPLDSYTPWIQDVDAINDYLASHQSKETPPAIRIQRRPIDYVDIAHNVLSEYHTAPQDSDNPSMTSIDFLEHLESYLHSTIQDIIHTGIVPLVINADSEIMQAWRLPIEKMNSSFKATHPELPEVVVLQTKTIEVQYHDIVLQLLKNMEAWFAIDSSAQEQWDNNVIAFQQHHFDEYILRFIEYHAKRMAAFGQTLNIHIKANSYTPWLDGAYEIIRRYSKQENRANDVIQFEWQQTSLRDIEVRDLGVFADQESKVTA